MAENKKSFLLYVEQKELFNDLTDEEAGKLIKHIFSYVSDENPILEDRLLKIAFGPIKYQLKRDLVKYIAICERNSINGAKGGRPKEPKKPTGLSGNPKEPKKADNDNDNDNDNEIEYHSQDENKKFSLDHCSLIALKDDKWVAASGATKESLEKFNIKLTGDAEYEKNAADYKKHFNNWKKKGGLDFALKKQKEIQEPPKKSFAEIISKYDK